MGAISDSDPMLKLKKITMLKEPKMNTTHVPLIQSRFKPQSALLGVQPFLDPDSCSWSGK